jgi:hypothetical protein
MKLSFVLATALAVAAAAPEKADLKDVTRHPDKYMGKTIAVDGEVIDVLGPHLFVVDAPRWLHLFGGIVVIVPEPFAAVVRCDAPIHLTGTVEKVMLAEAKRKWAFLNDPAIEIDLFEKPVVAPAEVTTITPSVASLRFQPGQPAAGSRGETTIRDASVVAKAGDSSMAGRRVDLSAPCRVRRADGFWLKTMSGDDVFELPASKTSARTSQKCPGAGYAARIAATFVGPGCSGHETADVRVCRHGDAEVSG